MRLLSFILCVVNPLQADDAIDRIVHDAMKAWQVPGVAIAIVQNDNPAILKAYGNRNDQDPLQIDDVFPLASCSKAFTASLIANLVHEGKMNWDDPIRKHLPGFHLSDPNADALVTLRDLLTHRTGVNGHDLLWYHSRLTNDEILKRIEKLPLNAPFRGTYQYSTLMYLAAGRAASNAGGKSWESLIQEQFVDPLGLKSVTFTTDDPSFIKSPKAIGHRRSSDGKLEVMPRYEIHEPNPAGSINLSIRDMGIWLRHQLTATALAEIHSPQIVIPITSRLKPFHTETIQLSYGMGWIISDYRGLKVLVHGGMIDGFRTLAVLVPERKFALAIFSNLHGSKMNQALGNSLLDHCLGLAAKDWNASFLKATADENARIEADWKRKQDERKTLRGISRPEEQYAGEYENPAYGTAKIVWKDGKLIWSWSSFTTPLEYWGNDFFRFTDGYLKDQFAGFRGTPNGIEATLFQDLIFTKKP